MKLEYAPPPADLAEYISAFYLFEADCDQFEDIERADLAQFRVILDGKATAILPDGREMPYLPVTVLGPRMSPSRTVATGPKLRLFGFGLSPAGWFMGFNTAAEACVDQFFCPRDLIGRDMADLPSKLGALGAVDEMVAAIVDHWRGVFASADPAPLWFTRIVDRWLEAGLFPDIAQLEAETGLTRRQLEKQMRHYYGAPPKLLIRKYRALRAASAMANGEEDWQSFVDEGFYDQPHFIRDIKQFTGQTPGAIRSGQSPLSTLVFGRSKLMGDVRPLYADS